MRGAPGMPNGAAGLPNGGAPGVPPGTEAWAAGVPLGEFAILDVDRRRRTGVPEVVFGEGKTSEQIFALLAELRARDPEAPALATLARRRGFAAVLSGANADDTGDWRPGLRAAAEHGVRHPLLEASVGKDQVRALAQHLRVPSADKPASPCLASRLPYGTPVSADVLSQIDRAELSLKQRGYRELRVRHFGDLGRVQLGAAELPRAADPDEHAAVLACVRAAGYQRAEIDEQPLRSGSLNLDITPVSRAG